MRAKITTLEWIRVADPNAGVADDFQFQSGGVRYALQVKWAQYPGAFGWAELVNPSGEKASLFERLAQAWKRIREDWSGSLKIRLWSNERPSVNSPHGGSALALCPVEQPRHFAAFIARAWIPIQRGLRDGKSWTEVAAHNEVTDWQPAWNALRKSSALKDSEFANFVSDLELSLGPAADDPLLRPDEEPFDYDLEHLAATLQGLVADPARPMRLTRDELLKHLGWSNRLKFRNKHDFPVPAIYTANRTARSELQARLETLSGGYVALVGPAGAGKSTLLASLNWPKRRVVRYYAFVPDAADPLSGRGEAESFLHDVSLALEGVGYRRGGHGNDLRSQRTVLNAQLADAGERWRIHSESTVIVVDGLDHIPREQNPTRSLLDELPAPAALPEGVFMVLGTQTTRVAPAAIQDVLTGQNRIIEVPPLTHDEVLRIAETAGPGSWLLPGQLSRLVIASEGHPLALTYLLQELAEISTQELPAPEREAAADKVLNNSVTYGREVAARYRGYQRAVGDDRDLMDVVASVARMRKPIDIEWLREWVPAPTLEIFIDRTATFFRREGSIWRFIHNSFRRFLIEVTGEVAGRFDEARDQSIHLALAEVCRCSEERWTIYRDEELTHRFLAREYSRVIELATPSALRDKLFTLRPIDVVRDHARIALRAAAELGDLHTFVRMVLFHNELWQRQMVLESESIAEAMVTMGPPERALEHLIAAGQLRVPAPSAMKTATRFARDGLMSQASEILQVAPKLAEIITQHPRSVGDWTEASLRLSDLDSVLKHVDDVLTELQAGSQGPATLASDSDETPQGDLERRMRDNRESTRRIAGTRNAVLARCFDVLLEIRDEERLHTLLERIDAQSTVDWRARARVALAMAASEDGEATAVVRWAREVVALHTHPVEALLDETIAVEDTAADEEDATTAPGVRVGRVPLHLRLRTAEALLQSGLVDAPEVDLLVPPETMAAWPRVSYGDDGLAPYRTLVDLDALRVIKPRASAPAADVAYQPRTSRDAGTERFRRALQTLAELEGRQSAARLGRGSRVNVAAEAESILRLVEVPREQSQEWTGWYAVVEALPKLYQRLARLAASDGVASVLQLLGRFAAAWTDPQRSKYWSPKRQLQVLQAISVFAEPKVRAAVLEHLERLDRRIGFMTASPHELTEIWLAQAKTWAAAGQSVRSEAALSSAVRASWGPGFNDHDTQLMGWLAWMRTAVEEGALGNAPFADAVRDYAGRLQVAQSAGDSVSAAAAELIQLVWRSDAALSARLAESLCDASVIPESEAIQAVLLGAIRDPAVPDLLTAELAAELLIPLHKHPLIEFRNALEQRQGRTVQDSLGIVDEALALWAVPDGSIASSDESAWHQDRAADILNPHRLPTSATVLLGQLRRVESAPGNSGKYWAAAVAAVSDIQVTPAVAAALLEQAVRLRLDGEALGGIAAMAARVGLTSEVTAAVSEALARTPAYGWIRGYDGGPRLGLFRAALRDHDPALARLAMVDLAGALSTDALVGEIYPDDLRRILATIGSSGAVGDAWPDVVAHLAVFAPLPPKLTVADTSLSPAASPVEALLRWATGYFGHPVPPRDFGARRALRSALIREEPSAQVVLAESIDSGGWRAEAALHVLVTAKSLPETLSPVIVAAITQSVASDDAIISYLARKVSERISLNVSGRPPRPLTRSYELQYPTLRPRTPPEADSRGINMIDVRDPQQLVAPFDLSLRAIADAADVPERAAVHRAGALALRIEMPWLRGGHHEHAARLASRGQRHTFRPWAYMAGRRALGMVMAELQDAGRLDTDLDKDPCYGLELIDEVLVHIHASALDDTTPEPWRPLNTPSYDTKGWCLETTAAAEAYASVLESSQTFVLAEYSDWCSLEWGKPEEHREIHTRHGAAHAFGLVLPSRRTWEASTWSASRYPLLHDIYWSSQQLIVQGREIQSDAPWRQWLALHPAVGRIMGWTPDAVEPFCWRGTDGLWRARSVLRVRGQLSHDAPSHAYCAEAWQVVLSGTGKIEMRNRFGALRRELVVKRVLPARRREGRSTSQFSAHRVSLDAPS